jgi:hypothetical protein
MPLRAGGSRRPPSATRPYAAATTAGPPRVRLQIQRAELVHADNHIWVAVQDVVGAIHIHHFLNVYDG